MKKELVYYETATGKRPFEEWLLRLRDTTALTHIYRRIDYLLAGHYGDYKELGKGLKELRIHSGAGYRVYFAEVSGLIIVLLCGGTKNTPKGQHSDIAQARKYLQDFLDRSI